MRPIDADALILAMCKLCNQDYSDEPCEPSDCVFMRAIREVPTLTPSNEPLTCEGCAEIGKWENEYEYGYPSPCACCKRRACDNYRRPPERQEDT